ncbi:uncharacterized protein LOC135171111 isoform X2 [Diachasmimorpha longicaudata]|uniref:uncharacterized protein LOC135171111 isoform X2 n=1 Tax=Diachasmimorpha longicaudata TaxID=58733 RepID=UPI0030B9085F
MGNAILKKIEKFPQQSTTMSINSHNFHPPTAISVQRIVFYRSSFKSSTDKRFFKMKIWGNILAGIFFLLVQLTAGKNFRPILLPGTLASWSWTMWNYFRTSPVELGPSEDLMKIRRMWNQLGVIQRVGVEQIINFTKEHSDMIFMRVKVLEAVREVDSVFSHFTQNVLSDNEIMRTTDWCVFASRQLYSNKLTDKIDAVIKTIIPPYELYPSLPAMMSKVGKSNARACSNESVSIHSMHAVYEGILAIEARTFIIQAFAHSFLSRHNGALKQCTYRNGNAYAAIREVQNKFRDHLRLINREFVKRMSETTNRYRTCAEQETNFIEGATYFTMTGAISTVLELPSSVHLGELGNPSATCSTIDTELKGRPYCSAKWKVCATHPTIACHGRIFNCKLSSADLIACPTENGLKRYDWILPDSVARRDDSIRCRGKKLVDFRAIEETCICECNDNHVDSQSVHIINLRPVESDAADNMVVTGVRFIVAHGIMQLQIQQGKLSINFKVEQVHWKPIDDISDEVRHARLQRAPYKGLRVLQENKDFMILKKGVNNAVNLDSLVVPSGCILTGVKFALTKGETIPDRISLALIARKIKLNSGNLVTNTKKIIVPKDRHDSALRYDLAADNRIVWYSKSTKYIEIDAGRVDTYVQYTTLPYFDALPVESRPPAPLGGVELFYKPRNQESGFISLGLIGLNYTNYMENSEKDLNSMSALFPLQRESLVGSSEMPSQKLFM